MSQAAPPALTVRSDGSTRTFAPGHDVVVGRDLRADVRIGHPLVSRSHVLLRYDQGRWMAIDNGSLNGMFVDQRRVPMVDIRDGQSIHIGNPDGPQLTFEVGRHMGSVGRPPQTSSVNIQRRPSGQWPAAQQSGSQQLAPPRPPQGYPPSGPQPPHAPSGSQPRYPSGPQQQARSGPQSQAGIRRAPSPPAPQPVAAQVPDATQIRAKAEVPNLATSVLRILRPGAAAPPQAGAVTIGRAVDNHMVIPDVLASRHHATLVPTPQGVEIQDANSINGTFVNGSRVKEALLKNGDVVTIGNVDLVFNGTTLVRRTETEAATKTGGLEVRGITLTIEHGRTLLDNISFSARPGTLTAIIGPSGAGKSTLSNIVSGSNKPTGGTVTFEGHNIHAEYASLRSRIGMVPQEDVVHRQLTVDTALGYAAELRLPPDTTKEDRRQVMAQVLDELELTQHAEKRVDKLSGGQRKRASVAMELLTGPSLLILDEPTSGLDPALDRQVMTMLRQLADAGRVVLVVTHSLTYLDVCDQVLLLAPGGKTAFCGPPSDIGRAMGTTNWADIFTKVGEDPDAVHRRFLERAAPPPTPLETEQPADLGKPVHTSLLRQFSTCTRRQVRLLVADRGYFIFLAVLPFIMGALALAVPGTTGFGSTFTIGPDGKPITIPGTAPSEPQQILVMLNVGAVFMGTALTIRDLIGERPIFRREQAVGLSASAYLAAKVVVYCTAAVIQAAVVVAITVAGTGAPPLPALVLGNSSVELFAAVAGTTVAAAITGLALSALARTTEQIMPLLVVAIMSQLVFSGGMIAVTHRIGLDQLSWLTPARWGFAASAATIDLRSLEAFIAQDSHWSHYQGGHYDRPPTSDQPNPIPWLFDMAMLVVLSLTYGIFVRWRLRLKGG